MCFEKKEQLLDFASNPSIFFDASRSKGLGLRLSQRQRIEVELISFLLKEMSYLLWLFRHVELEGFVICCIFAGPKLGTEIITRVHLYHRNYVNFDFIFETGATLEAITP